MVDSGAILSPSEAYRYLLWRIWQPERPVGLFIMLNPSTADSRVDDPTIRRCYGFAEREGWGGFRVANLFALRSTDPSVLGDAADPVGPLNDDHLLREAVAADAIVCAWGSHPAGADRAIEVMHLLRGPELYCLGRTKSGAPRHPLYLQKTSPLIPFSVENEL